jgi:putative ABC transport system substrate-binding protein
MALITRRRLTAALGGMAMTSPLPVRAQQPAVIGFLFSTAATDFPENRLTAFRQGLGEQGYVEGQNLKVEYRWEEQSERLAEQAADLVGRGVAAIVVTGATLKAAMAATSTIPIVFVAGTDPVKQGLVPSLSRPGGNVTGVSFLSPDLSPKRLELLLQFVPRATVIAALLDSKGPAFDAQSQALRKAASDLGQQSGVRGNHPVRIIPVTATSEVELDSAFITIRQAVADALFVGSSAFFTSQRRKLVALAKRHALPASYEGRQFVELGGLMSYGARATDTYRLGGSYVGLILNGKKSSDLPILLPTKFELVINRTTAKELGLDVPPMLMVWAEVIR